MNAPVCHPRRKLARDGLCASCLLIVKRGHTPAALAPCSFAWTIRNHPSYDECSDQWCSNHQAWRREEPPREFCDAVTLAGVGETVDRLAANAPTAGSSGEALL